MQFVKNGPDVPNRLLQAHEDSRVVFFCGAGISRRAGLPDFDGLVKQLYGNLSVTPDTEQQKVIKTKRFDMAIGLLEKGIVDGREGVRKELAKILTPNLDAPNATTTHEALLKLSRNREGRTRLVTTNFDRLFEEAIDRTPFDVERFQAPMLPMPKSQWNGLIYLHGLLSEKPSAQELGRLVVSSGDFGLAYLTERWASRFVGELFRNHTVCFVGYSIDDPVLRYMTDALAADRLLGESPLEMFAFGSYSKDKEADCAGEWKAKNVTPILYREHKRHWYLHETLHEWAKTYHDGIHGKEQIVTRYASLRPLESTKQDDFVGRVLWALGDSSGLPAKRFADHDPVLSLDWLEPLGEERYGRADLSRFGITPRAGGNDDLVFSLIRRPSPYEHAPPMMLVDEGVAYSRWDDVMFYLAHWLLRHLDDPKLLLWSIGSSERLHRRFAELVETHLRKLDKLESSGNTDELHRIRDNAPHAIPGPAMRTLWRLILSGRMKSPRRSLDIHDWRDRFKRDGLTAASRLELRDLLTPRVSLRKPLPWHEERKETDKPERIEDLVDWNIVLSSMDVRSELPELSEIPRWTEALPDLLDDFGALLRDALDLMRDLGGANEVYDRSPFDQPSIEDHSQNRNCPDWTALIELTRDAWLATAAVAPEQAKLVAESWRFVNYPVFKRLAFFAASREAIISPRQGLDWLLADDHRWLWSPVTRREAFRLLVTSMPKLGGDRSIELERAILAGPPRSMHRKDIEDQQWVQIAEWEVWRRLAKMNEAGTTLGTDASAKLDELTSRYPNWRLSEEDRDEFPVWRGDGRELRRLIHTPRHRRELVGWLRQHPEPLQWPDEDDWGGRCRDEFPVTACALYALARDGNWPVARWHEALQAWSSEKKLLKPSWRRMAPVLMEAEDDVLRPLAHSLGRWLQALSRTRDRHEALFFDLCRQVLRIDDQDDVDENTHDPVTRAIGHPVGQVTGALLDWWYRSSPEDGQGIPDDLKPVFSEICDSDVERFRHGRVLLAAHTISLFRVDREWTERHLFPLFDWHCKVEARAVWEGFLGTARFYPPLMESIKYSFLDTVHHYESLGPDAAQYPILLTFAALEHRDIFTARELTAATAALPEEGLQRAADTLEDLLNGSGERRPEYWRNRALPYLRKVWPKSSDWRTPSISKSLGKVCIAAGDAFPEALEQLRHWLQPPQYPGDLIDRLRKSGLCGKFSEDALTFLDLIVGEKPLGWTDLKECLKQIQAAESGLTDDPRFKKLRDRLRQLGQELE